MFKELTPALTQARPAKHRSDGERVKAHQQLDKAVDLCYRQQPFISETKRIEFLFELYDKYTAGLFAKEKKKKQ